MKNPVLLLLAVFSLLAANLTLTSCNTEGGVFCVKGKGAIETRTYEFSQFTGVAQATRGDVYITEDSVWSIRAEGQANVLDELEFSFEGNTLVIDSDKCIGEVERLEIFISIPNLEEVILSGSGHVFGTNLFHSTAPDIINSGSGMMDFGFQAPEVEAVISGSGNVDLDVICNNFTSSLTGSGDLNVEGSTLSQTLLLSGTGEFTGYGLNCQNGEFTNSGAGDARIYVQDQMDVTISGSGDIFYRGNPIIISTITGSGKLINDN